MDQVIVGEREDLGLVVQATKRRRKDDAVGVALKVCARGGPRDSGGHARVGNASGRKQRGPSRHDPNVSPCVGSERASEARGACAGT